MLFDDEGLIMADEGRIMDACHPFWGSPTEDILKMTEDTEYCPQIGIL